MRPCASFLAFIARFRSRFGETLSNPDLQADMITRLLPQPCVIGQPNIKFFAELIQDPLCGSQQVTVAFCPEPHRNSLRSMLFTLFSRQRGGWIAACATSRPHAVLFIRGRARGRRDGSGPVAARPERAAAASAARRDPARQGRARHAGGARPVAGAGRQALRGADPRPGARSPDARRLGQGGHDQSGHADRAGSRGRHAGHALRLRPAAVRPRLPPGLGRPERSPAGDRPFGKAGAGCWPT